MSDLAHPLADIFLLGYIAACCLVAGVFFVRFWRTTRDKLFLAFAVFFVVLGGSDAIVVSFSRPNEGADWLTLARLVSVVGVVGAIFWKNSDRR